MSRMQKAEISELTADRSSLTEDDSQPALFRSSAQNLSIDDIMWRVRAEVTRRRNGHVSEQTPVLPDKVPSFDESMPNWKPAAPRLPTKDKYLLAELLGFSDADFVDIAYRTVLRRPPDESGFNHYLQLLRSRATTKVEILWILSSSEEGKAVAVQIDGLFWPYTLQKWRRKPFVGPIIAWAHALLRLGATAERQAALAAIQAQETQELGRLLNEASSYLQQRMVALKVQLAGRPGAAEFEALRGTQSATAALLNKLESTVERELADRPGTAEFEALRSSQSTTAAHVNKLESTVERELATRPDDTAFVALRDDYVAAALQLAELSALVRAKFQAYEEYRKCLESRLESATASVQQVLAHDQRATEVARALDPFYAAFEDRFRGDRSVIRARVEPYVALVREAAAGTSVAPVVDVGCGRGEWLEVLRDHGLIGRGLDINRVFVDVCRGRGFEVIEGDAIESLRSMPDGSVGAITSMHFVEHLPFEQVIALLDEARRVLRPGGLIVLETPNPENLSVGHHWFYMDPTHRNPLPPEALRWIVEARGFHAARIERLVEAREQSGPALLSGDVPGATSINAVLASLNAAPDYAIVAKRP